jgi:hypothetical protein
VVAEHQHRGGCDEDGDGQHRRTEDVADRVEVTVDAGPRDAEPDVRGTGAVGDAARSGQ